MTYLKPRYRLMADGKVIGPYYTKGWLQRMAETYKGQKTGGSFYDMKGEDRCRTFDEHARSLGWRHD